MDASAAVIFSDGFETGDLTQSANGFAWGGSTGTTVDDTNPRAGSYSLHYTFTPQPDDDAWAEQRFQMGNRAELWFRYWVYYPSNYALRNSQNNKFFILWRDTYSGSAYLDIESWRCNDLENSACPSYGSSYGPLHLKYNGVDRGHHHPFDTHLDAVYGQSADPASIFAEVDRGRWIEYIIHYKLPTTGQSMDGVVELWKNGVKEMEYLHLSNYDNGGNYFNYGYLLGWANTGFDAITHMYIDDITVSDTPLSSETQSDPTPPATPTGLSVL